MQATEAADRTGDAFALLGWLEAASLQKLAPALEANEVASVEDLLDLTPEDVKELVPPVGLRNRFLKALAHLRADAAAQQQQPRAAAAVAPAASAASGAPKAYTTPYLVDSQYVAERQRREASRVRQRQQNLAQERERWMQLLNDSATRRRDEERRRTEARRRSLSRGTAARTPSSSAAAAHRTPLRAGRRTASAGPSPATSRVSAVRTPACRSAAPSPFCGSATGAAAPAVGSRTPRLRPSCPRGGTPPAASSPGRRRVWLRSTASPAVSTPPQPPAAAAAAEEAEEGEGASGNSPHAVLSPSPPPPSGSPSPEAILNARRFSAYSEPVGVPTLACVEDASGTADSAEPQSVQRNRLLTLIEQNKQQRLRYWIEPKTYVSPCGTEDVWDEVKQP